MNYKNMQIKASFQITICWNESRSLSNYNFLTHTKGTWNQIRRLGRLGETTKVSPLYSIWCYPLCVVTKHHAWLTQIRVVTGITLSLFHIWDFIGSLVTCECLLTNDHSSIVKQYRDANPKVLQLVVSRIKLSTEA